nr:MAG TPA: hypothetical protein [Caudoviricetes sp.]
MFLVSYTMQQNNIQTHKKANILLLFFDFSHYFL